MTITAKVICDSISPDDIRLTTLQLRYPRFIHAEFMTHRVFSRNARSSRAVPVERMIEEVLDDPATPSHWGKNKRGMQADEESDEPVSLGFGTYTRETAWRRAMFEAVGVARAFADAGYHKQIVNRLLEPFMHIDTLVTSTEWSNFFALRDEPGAQPEMQELARAMKAAMEASTPKLLQPGQWHLPYVDAQIEDDGLQSYRRAIGEFGMHFLEVEDAKKLSVARCARLSIKPFDGNDTIEAELARFDRLMGAHPKHASPAEHQATPDYQLGDDWGNPYWKHPEEHGNFRGWRQYRKMIPGECL